MSFPVSIWGAVNKSGKLQSVLLDGTANLTATVPCGQELGWLMGVMVPEAKAMGAIGRLLYGMLGLMVGSLVVGFFVTSIGIARLMNGISLLRMPCAGCRLV